MKNVYIRFLAISLIYSVCLIAGFRFVDGYTMYGFFLTEYWLLVAVLSISVVYVLVSIIKKKKQEALKYGLGLLLALYIIVCAHIVGFIIRR